MDRKRSACRLLAAATRLTRLGLALPSVTSNLVSAKPAAFNFSSIRCARRRLKTNSATLRALIAPSDSAVCPTSRTIRNFEGSQLAETGFKAEGGKAAGPRAASFAEWSFGEAAGFAKAARFREMTRFADLSCFDELLKTSDSQPASLTSIGSSTNAAIAAMMVRWGQNPAAIPPRMQITSRRFMLALPKAIIAARIAISEEASDVGSRSKAGSAKWTFRQTAVSARPPGTVIQRLARTSAF